MHWVRTFLVSLLHVALLVILLLGAVLLSTGRVLENPNQVEQLLSSDTVYQKLLDEGVQRARDLGDAMTQSVLPNSSEAELRSALSAAFPKPFLDSSVRSVVDANYAWLRGATPAPRFSVDVAAGKQRFASNVSQVLVARLRAVPECSLTQLKALQISTLSTLSTFTCRPPGINIEVEATQVEQQIIHAQSFLSGASITQDTIAPGQGRSPYYRRLARLPQAFQALHYAPYLCALVALLLALTAVYMLPNRRRGIWKVARTLLIAGFILASAKIAGTITYNELRSYLLHSGVSSSLQQLALNITHNSVRALSHTELIVGVLYSTAAVVIIIGLLITRFAKNKQRDGNSGDDRPATLTETATPPIAPSSKKKRPVMDIIRNPTSVALLSKEQMVLDSSANETVVDPGKKPSKLGKRGIIQ